MPATALDGRPIVHGSRVEAHGSSNRDRWGPAQLCLVDVELHMQIAGGLVGACWARSITISGFRDGGRTECSSVLGLRNLARRFCQLQFQMSAFQALRRLRAIQSFLIRPSTAAATSVPNPTSKYPRSNQGSPRAFRSCRCAGADLSFSPQQRIRLAV